MIADIIEVGVLLFFICITLYSCWVVAKMIHNYLKGDDDEYDG